MRVAIVHTRPVGGGAEQHAMEVARAWCTEPSLDAQVELLMLEGVGNWPDPISIRERGHAIPQGPLGRIWWYLTAVFWLHQELRDGDYEVLLTFLWIPTTIVGLAALGLPSRPRIAWAVQSDLERAFAVRSQGCFRRFLTRLVARHRVDHFAAISNGHLARTAHFLDIPRSRFALIPNSVRQFGPRCKRRRENDVLQVVCVARLHRQKGVDVLLRALALVPDVNVRCDIVGEGEQWAQLEDLVQELGLSSVEFRGFREDIETWLKSADLFVLPSRWEPFGIAVVEAMACGLPVIATRVDGPQDVIRHGANGLLVEAGNPEELATAIRVLAFDPELRNRLGTAAAEDARSYAPRAIAEHYQSWLSGVA
jgi:glycosyltransferase involved in cell wall biosynthesis